MGKRESIYDRKFETFQLLNTSALALLAAKPKSTVPLAGYDKVTSVTKNSVTPFLTATHTNTYTPDAKKLQVVC